MKTPTFIFFFLSLSILALVHALALEFYLYWMYVWLDILVHLLGGVTVALGFLTFLHWWRGAPASVSLFSVLVVVLLVGAAWEVFEYANGLIDMEESPLFDTLLDFVMDCVGGALGYVLGRSSTLLES